MKTRTVQLALGSLFIVGAVAASIWAKSDEVWGWLVLGAILCVPGCMM